MATVYLHIGAPKTAAPALQGVLADNHEQLLARGVLYPGLLRQGNAHHILASELIRAYQGQPMSNLWQAERTRDEAWQTLQREIKQHQSRIDKIILSSELFFGQTQRLEEMLADIRSRLAGHELKAVVYLRRQDELYNVFFSQDVAGARQWAHNAYQFYQTHQIFQHDYDELLAIWSRGIGRNNMLVRSCETAQLAGGNLVEDFCRVTGIEPLRASCASPSATLGPTQLYIKLCLNRVGFDKSENQNLLDLLQQVWPEPPVEGCIYVHRELYRGFRQRWIQVNQRLEEAYLGGAPLFTSPIPAPEKVALYQPELPGILDCLRALFEHFDQERQHPLRSLFGRAMLLILAEKDLWEAFGRPRRDHVMQWL